MAGDPLDILSIYPAQDLTIAQCRDLGAYFYDLYAWESDERDHLWCAAMALYLVRMAELRDVPDDAKTIYEVSAAVNNRGGPPYRPLAYMEYSIPNMVQQYKKQADMGERALNTMVMVTGLNK